MFVHMVGDTVRTVAELDDMGPGWTVRVRNWDYVKRACCDMGCWWRVYDDATIGGPRTRAWLLRQGFPTLVSMGGQ
ncbi:hypothetical protein LWF01_02735 [Saxibacter everestensis]|uniref:Uncharacterized protein n=1 Tax=Saxibacter everestensis TaxID=2909229 RepID=A0ABY8QWE4_9MICO|nr:hypothetical protein LWF01_02735 [Brevibacteriaceae bacterium ZFBP1038]